MHYTITHPGVTAVDEKPAAFKLAYKDRVCPAAYACYNCVSALCSAALV
jgi:hypothetical protein